jgi:hypothetical protein
MNQCNNTKIQDEPVYNLKLNRGTTGYWSVFIVLVFVLITVSIRIRLLEVPLERDEGEYAYAGQLILQGIPPYALVYNMKMPGIYAAYAIIMAFFGQSIVGIHLGLLIVNTATIVLMFMLAKKFFAPFIAAIAAVFFALLSLGQLVHGVYTHAEHFVIFFVVSAVLLLLRAVECQKWPSLLAGALLLGISFLMKQHSAAFVVFGGLYLLFCELRHRPFLWKYFAGRVLLFLFGAFMPFVVTCLILKKYGVFEKFWFWTFDYASKYVSSVTIFKAWSLFKKGVVQIGGSAILLWLLAVTGPFLIWSSSKIRRRGLFLSGFFLFSFLAVCPGFYFRPHYFILLLPSFSLLAAASIASLRDFLVSRRLKPAARIITVLLVIAVILHTLYQQRDYFFVMSPTMVSRVTYGSNPFPESLKIASYIEEHSGEKDRIAVVGSEPQIYFYSNRLSATGYIYTYALMETHGYALKMQKEMISEVESSRPAFLVFVNITTSWMNRPDSERMILRWFKEYQEEYYELVGIVDIFKDKTVYRWDEDAASYSPKSNSWLTVFRRKK